MRLLNAMNQFKLEVPAWVLKVESELKAEWEMENRKLKKGVSVMSKKATQSSIARDPGIGSSQVATGGVNVSVNLTLTPGVLSYGQYMDAQQAKSPSNKRKRTGSDLSSPIATPQKAARAKKEPITKRPISTTKKEDRVSAPPSTPSRSRVKQEQYNPKPMRSSPYIKPDPYHNYYQSELPLLLSGIYSINCETASFTFNDYNLDLALVRYSSHGLWWATFRWGAWDGIIQMNPGPTDCDSLGLPCLIGWRLRDLETGKLTFGRKCTGTMTFFRDGTMDGCLYEVPGVGDLVFEGRRMAGENLEDDLKEEWDGFVTEACRR